jgi:type VI secretion system protein ImpA
MAKGPLLDVEALIKPIIRTDADAAKEGYVGGAGDPALFDEVLKDELEEWRREDPPPTPGANPPANAPAPKKGEWKKIETRIKESLAKSKDLRLVGYLTESLVKQHGLAGLRDGLLLFRRLCEASWEKLYPDVKDGIDMRLDPLANMFDGASGKGLNIPQAVVTSPLTNGPKGRFSVLDYEMAQRPGAEAKMEAFNQSVQASKPEDCKNELDAVGEALAEREKLHKHLQTRLGNTGPAPGFVKVRECLEKCQVLARTIWEKIKPVGPPPGEETDKGAEDGKGAAKGPPRAVASRAEVYRQLADCARLLRELEPHSPIPYLIQRCVDLGALPFPDMIKELVRKDDVLKDMNRELGIKEAGPPPKK